MTINYTAFDVEVYVGRWVCIETGAYGEEGAISALDSQQYREYHMGIPARIVSKFLPKKAEIGELREKQIDLLDAAGMTIYDLNTGVLMGATNDGFRILVRTPHNDLYGDHVGIQVMLEKNSPYWYETILTPARARILAYHLLRKAAIVESKR